MKYSIAFIAVFCLLGAINASPTHQYPERTTICARKCLNHENNLFKEIGSTTTMNYETTSEIVLENGQKTQISVKAKVDISTISKCEYQMRLRKVQIDGPREAETMKKQLERHATKFSQDNSRLESICFDREETWVLNLKKAILSTLQVSVHQKDEQIVEKDVMGYCKTKYEKTGQDTLKKTKFLSSCSKRSESINSILTGDFDRNKKSTCKIHLDNDKQILKSVTCEEMNSMLPFGQSKASGRVSTTTRLTFDKTERRLQEIVNKQLIRDSLVFNKKQHNRQSDQSSREIVQDAEQLIKEIRSEIETNVKKETPEKIKKLSQKLAFLNVNDLERLAQQVSDKDDKVKDIFFDTVAQTGTQETAHIILKVLLDRQFYNGEVSKLRKAYWLAMVSNVDQVTDEILSIAVEHLKNDRLPRQALLALTSMINEIKDDEEIKQDRRYQQVVETLIEKLNRQSDEKEKIVILKALRNTGIHGQVFEQILNIAQQKSRDVETKVAAIQALEEHVDDERMYKKLLKIFEDSSNEAEIRIAAFQVLVGNQERVRDLYNVLKNESNKQVGSYVVSYFKNARESQLSEHETLRRIVSDFDLPTKRFERNDFRQSKHIQFTQEIGRFDLGAKVEADLIFDEQKELRNIKARFDLNKEKEQLKSVEIQLRQKGLPEVAQKMLEELTRQSNLDAIVDEIKEISSIRSKDQLKQKVNRFAQLFKFDKINLNSRRFSSDVDASIHIRVEDKTVLYLNLKDIQEIASTLEQYYNRREQIVNQIFDSFNGDNAITFILSSKQHKMPTGHGLPVHSGHSIVVVTGLKVDQHSLYPSIASDYHYEMGFTAMNNRPAVHYHLQMNSAPGLKTSVEFKNGLPTSVKISMPEDRLEIVSVKSIVKLQTATQEIELDVSKEQNKGRTDVLDKVFGVELGYKATYPRNLVEKDAWNVLFNGPFELGLNLEKTDSSIKYWEIVFETPLNQRSNQVRTLHFGVRAVGSRKEREISAKIDLQNERDSKIVNIELRTPLKSAKIEGKAQYTDRQIGVKAALIVDSQRFEVEIGGEKTNQNGEQEFRPSFKMIIPGLKKIHYNGKIALTKSGKKENFQIELKDTINNRPIIKASVIKSGRIDLNENFKLATDLQAFWFTGSSVRFASNVDKNSKGFTADIEAIHSTSRRAPTTYKWKVALQDLSNEQNTKYNADLELNIPNTEFENVALSWNFVNKARQEIESEFTGFWNNRNGQKTRQVHILHQSKMNKLSAKISSLNENLLKIEIVPLSVNYEIQAKTNWQRSQEKYNVQITARNVKTNKQYKGEMSYQLPESKPFKMNLNAKVMIENDEFKISHNIEEQENQQYHGYTMVQLRKGQTVELSYVYRMKEHSMREFRINHELDAEIRVPSESILIKHKSAFKLNVDEFEIRQSLRSGSHAISDVKISLDKRNGQSKLFVENKIFQIKVDGDWDQSRNQQKIDVSFDAKKQRVSHQTRLDWQGKQQIKLDSKTTKEQRQIADVSVDYRRNQNTDAKIFIEKLGELKVQHQPNDRKWATVEIKSDYLSKPLEQKFSIEKQSNNKYIIRSKTHQNQEVVGQLDLELGSQSSLKVAVQDWRIEGKTSGQRNVQLSLENSARNIKEDLEVEYRNRVAKVTFKHLNDQRRTSKLVGQVSMVEESKLVFENQDVNVDFTFKPRGEDKYISLKVDDKKHNIQHQSELRCKNSVFYAVLDHTKDNQVVIKHNTKLSLYEDSNTRTETKKFEVEAVYKRNTEFEFRFSNKQGLKHQTKVEIVDSKNKIAKIESKTTKNDELIGDLEIEIDTLKKVDVRIARKQDKEIKIIINLKDQQKRADLEIRFEQYELNSKWSKESHKDQKYTLEFVDRNRNSKYNVLAHHQRKTMLHAKIESSEKDQIRSGELKLHKNGIAFFKVDGKDLKMRTELNFERSPIEATVEFESRKYSTKHQTTLTFSQNENELKIKSSTDKDSRQIANVDLRINPTTKQIEASGQIDEKALKIEGNVNDRFSIELKNFKGNRQFRHLTVLDINRKSLNSETIKNDRKVHEAEIKLKNRFDVEGELKVKEHELSFQTNANAKQLEVSYKNKDEDIKLTGKYSIDRKQLSAKIDAQKRSKQIVDFEANLRLDDKSIDAKLNGFQTRLSAKIDVSDRNQVRANLEFENQKTDVKQMRLSMDTIDSNEKKISIRIHTQNSKYENEIKLVRDQELRVSNYVERNGKKLVEGNFKIEKPFKIDGKVQFETRDLKGQAKIETVGQNEIRFDLNARNGQEKKVADIRSKLTKRHDKLSFDVEFDSQTQTPYTLRSEIRKESSKQLTMNTIVKSNQRTVGKLDGKLRIDGFTIDAKLDGELNLNGKKTEIVYKLSNADKKIQHGWKVKVQDQFSYGYDLSIHLKQGKLIIHLPHRIVELRYDLYTQANGHILLNLEFLPNAEHQTNHIYAVKFDNMIAISNKELTINTETTLKHPEINHPIVMQSRLELRELNHNRPLVIYVSYDASSSQNNKISGLFEILNESNLHVLHFNISHQNQPILDINYRFILQAYLVHHQLDWSVLDQNYKRQTGEILGQINLKQRLAKLELNNKHKLQMNWEKTFDRNVIVQMKLQTDGLVKRTKIMTNNREKQIEITNYENERIVSTYLVSALKEKNWLAIEMHKKQGNKFEKVAFIQLVKDNLKYAKVHFKTDKSLIYEIESLEQQIKNKVRSVSRRHVQEISSIADHQYRKMQLDQQIENTSKWVRKTVKKVNEVADDFIRSIKQQLPRLSENVEKIYETISDYLRENWNIRLEERFGEMISWFMRTVQQVERKTEEWKDDVEFRYKRMSGKVQEIKDQFDHEVVSKISRHLEENVSDAIRFGEEESEKIVEFLRKNINNAKLNRAIEKVREWYQNVKRQVLKIKVKENLRDLVSDYQTKFEGKWDIRGDGEIIGKIPVYW